MLDFILTLFKSRTVFFVNGFLGLVVGIIMLYLFFQKNGRDERGRSIIGKASIVAMICLMVITTLLAHAFQLATPDNFDLYLCLNTIQFIYNTVVIVEIVAILIFRKLQ